MSQKPTPKSHLIAFCSALLLWLLLLDSWSLAEVVTGVVVSSVVVLASANRLAVLDGIRLTPTAVLSLLSYLLLFFITLIRANLDMARRVVSPSLPINPGLVEIDTELRSELGRMLLANTITLTPGTLAIDYRGDRLLVHWIDVPPGCDIDTATREIASGFERHIKGFLK